MKKIAVVFAGCGVMDGSEIHESVITLLHINRQGATYQCFAPDIQQHHVINHAIAQPSEETRNVFVESARIARGEINKLDQLNPENFDALIFPGGLGAAKNLCDFAFKAENMTINKQVETVIKAFHESGKPVGLICISPVLAPKTFGAGVKCTIGTDQKTAQSIEKMGGVHIACDVNNIVVDETHKLVTTPAYMLANSISEVDTGVGKLVQKIIALC
ncbi:MAG: isoprenoid biosynthesis glyoxalase ElbB [Endozoicomonadaceae bacterium]|nr:isoprenoid biosynthesis glyoxalase ElbB [Endozoicomonadaceae bacterium]MCY4329130.1 isoprenoid biosynthesis glyoxalase ElbB [Endozoicomonadaceae bacterium]